METEFSLMDPLWFRQIMGHYPTGVALVTSTEPDGTPVGMVVGTFTSVSLDPPLVAFLPGKTSTTWPRIRATGRFGISVLGSNQAVVSRAFGKRKARGFDEVLWHLTDSGLPELDQSVFWVECRIYSVHDAGDHEIVIGRVTRLSPATEDQALVFLQGGYGRFAKETVSNLSSELAILDRARPHVDELVKQLECNCIVGARVENEFVLLASSTSSAASEWTSSLVGQRVPAIAPFGRTQMAWSEPSDIAHWIDSSKSISDAEGRRLIGLIRARGYSLSVLGDGDQVFQVGESLQRALDPGVEAELSELPRNIHSISAPVLKNDGTAALVLSLYKIPDGLDQAGLNRYSTALLATSARITEDLYV